MFPLQDAAAAGVGGRGGTQRGGIQDEWGGGSSTSEGHLRMQEEQRREGSAWIKLDLTGNSSSAPPPRAGHSTVSAHRRAMPRPRKPVPVHSTRAPTPPPAEGPWAPPPRPGVTPGPVLKVAECVVKNTLTSKLRIRQVHSGLVYFGDPGAAFPFLLPLIYQRPHSQGWILKSKALCPSGPRVSVSLSGWGSRHEKGSQSSSSTHHGPPMMTKKVQISWSSALSREESRGRYEGLAAERGSERFNLVVSPRGRGRPGPHGPPVPPQ